MGWGRRTSLICFYEQVPSAGGGAVVEIWAGVHLCCLRHFWKANLDKLLPALSLMPLKVPQAAELIAKTAKSTSSSFKAYSDVFFLYCTVFSGVAAYTATSSSHIAPSPAALRRMQRRIGLSGLLLGRCPSAAFRRIQRRIGLSGLFLGRR